MAAIAAIGSASTGCSGAISFRITAETNPERYICPSPPRFRLPEINAADAPKPAVIKSEAELNHIPEYQAEENGAVKKPYMASRGLLELKKTRIKAQPVPTAKAITGDNNDADCS
jgi:hypothetical protein